MTDKDLRLLRETLPDLRLALTRLPRCADRRPGIYRYWAQSGREVMAKQRLEGPSVTFNVTAPSPDGFGGQRRGSAVCGSRAWHLVPPGNERGNHNCPHEVGRPLGRASSPVHVQGSAPAACRPRGTGLALRKAAGRGRLRAWPGSPLIDGRAERVRCARRRIAR